MSKKQNIMREEHMVKVKRKRHLVSKLIAVGLTLSLMTQSMEGFLFVTKANELTETEVETNANIISSVNKSDKLEEAIDSKEEEENQKEEKVLNQFKNENINESISLDVEDYSSEYIKIVWENHDESNILSYNVYRNGKFIKNVIGNVVMFIPYGIFASLYAKLDKPFHALCLVFFASVTVETTQLLIGRVFDIDDIILNVIGGLVGYGIYRLVDMIGDSIPKVFKSNWFLNCVSVILLGVFIGYIWMVMVR